MFVQSTLSKCTPLGTIVDFLSLLFNDSTIANAHALLNSSDMPAEEAYDLYILGTEDT